MNVPVLLVPTCSSVAPRTIDALAATKLAVTSVACSRSEVLPNRLDRETACRALSRDTLWQSLDHITEYPVGFVVPYACDNVAAAEEGDGGEAEQIRQAGLITLVDSSAILPDSVAHLCVYQPTAKLRELSAKGGTGRPPVSLGEQTGPYPHTVLRLRTYVAELDSVTGIQQADGAAEAAVEFTVRMVPTEWGNRFGMTEPEVVPKLKRALFDRYDDGWRLRLPE